MEVISGKVQGEHRKEQRRFTSENFCESNLISAVGVIKEIYRKDGIIKQKIPSKHTKTTV